MTMQSISVQISTWHDCKIDFGFFLIKFEDRMVMKFSGTDLRDTCNVYWQWWNTFTENTGMYLVRHEKYLV